MCVNECTFMSSCIAYYVYVNTYMYKCSFFCSWNNARAYICTFLEHHFIDDGPFQSVQQWFSWKYISKFSFSWILYFFTFCHSHVMYFWIRLSRGQSWHDKRSFKTVTLTTMDSLLVSPRFDSWQRACKKKNKKNKHYKWNVTHNRVSRSLHMYLKQFLDVSVWSSYFAHVKIIRLSDARPREHVDSGYGGGRHIGISGRPQPYFGKSAGWDLCHGSSSR